MRENGQQANGEAATSRPQSISAPEHQPALTLGYLESAANNLAAAITIPFAVPYAVTLGADPGQVGLLTALPLLAINLSQIPSARWVASSHRPGLHLLLAGSISRLGWLAMALLMLGERAGFAALLAATVAAGISIGLLSPIWTSFLAARVPARRRGSYFGTRNLIGGVGSLAGTGLGAVLVSYTGFERGYGLGLLAATLALSLALAAQVAAVGLSTGNPIAADPSTEGERPEGWRMPAVRNYALYGTLLILGAGISTPFFPVYFISHLGGAPELATFMIAAANSTTMLAQGLWGRVIDRRGLAPVAHVSLLVIALSPLLWLLTQAPIHAAPIWLLMGLAWAACNIANFNMVLAISNESNRAAVVAWVSVYQAPADFAAPLIGGFLAGRIDLPAVFLISAVLRLAAWGCFATRLAWRQ